mgnify:FL=1
MSQLKLTADSGGGTVAIKAPASTTGNAALDLTVPGTASATLDTLKRAGNVLQVKSAAKTDRTSIASNSTTIYDISGLSVDITAAAAGNKMLIIAMVSVSAGSSGMGTLLRRDSTSIFLGDSVGNRGQLTTNVENQANSIDCKTVPIMFLDTAPDTSQHTYKISVQETDSGGNTFYINRGVSDSDQANRAQVVSSITVMEIAA